MSLCDREHLLNARVGMDSFDLIPRETTHYQERRFVVFTLYHTSVLG
jgi:hypothetical protein